MRARGFTLVELLVVLAILALVMTLIPPFLAGGQARAELTTATREIAAALRETRSLAIREGRSAAFVVDGRTGTYRAAGGTPARQVPAGLSVALLTAGNERSDAGAIRFFGDGSSTGGGVSVMQGERRSDVLVDWLSGRVSLAAQ
jgi:general secretion pathway protein H